MTSNTISSTVNSDLSIAGAPLTLKLSPRARAMRLRVDPRGAGLVLTHPERISRRRAIAWAMEQAEWVAATLAAMPPAAPIVPGAAVPFRGVERRIDWDPARPRRVELEGDRILAGGPVAGLDRRIIRWLKTEALRLLDAETREFAGKAGVHVERVALGDTVSRWGSCSSAGSIRYSWRLVLAPDFVRRATVAHEAAHLVHMNHGPDFHALVRQLLEADPAPARQWLRQHGASLHRIGR